MLKKLKPAQRLMLMMLAVVTLVITLLYGLAPDADQQTPELSPLSLDVVPVNRLDQRLEILAWGRAEPAREIPMLAQVSGVVSGTDALFVSGAMVTEELTLMTLADEDYQLSLAQRENEVSAAQLHLEEVRAKARVARRVNGRDANAYALLVPHLREAETRLEAAQAARRQAQLQLERTQIRAPFAGRLRSVSVRQGQLVAQGQVLAQLYAPDVMEVRLPLSDHWLSLLAEQTPEGVLAAPIAVRLKARYGGRMQFWRGQVVRVEGGLDRNQMVTLVAHIPAMDDQVPPPPGVWLEAAIESRELDGLARLPRSVLGNDGAVWVVSADSSLQRRHVDVIYEDDESVFVGDGLRDGEMVAMSGNLRLLEGTPVTPRRAWMRDDHVGAWAP